MQTSEDRSEKQALRMAVAKILKEKGYGASEPGVLEELAEILGSYMEDMARICHQNAESGGRMFPEFEDLSFALYEMNVDAEDLRNYQIETRKKLDPPRFEKRKEKVQEIDVPVMKDEAPLPHPPYVAEHFPPLPDRHTFLKTPIHKKPLTDPALIQEMKLEQKRKIESGLKQLKQTTKN